MEIIKKYTPNKLLLKIASYFLVVMCIAAVYITIKEEKWLAAIGIAAFGFFIGGTNLLSNITFYTDTMSARVGIFFKRNVVYKDATEITIKENTIYSFYGATHIILLQVARSTGKPVVIGTTSYKKETVTEIINQLIALCKKHNTIQVNNESSLAIIN